MPERTIGRRASDVSAGSIALVARWRPALEELRPGWTTTLDHDRLEELCDMLEHAYREARDEHRLPREQARAWALERLGALTDLDDTFPPAATPKVPTWNAPSRSGGSSRTALALDGLRLELRGAFRSLRRDAWSAGFSILVLALGLGSTIALFSLVQAVVLRDLPHTDAHRLGIVQVDALNVENLHRISPSNVLDFRESAETLESLQIGGFPKLTLGRGADRRLAYVASMDSGLPAMLGVRPALGRLFDENIDAPERGFGNVLLSHETWSERYGADPDIVGKSILLSDREVQVVGVLEEGQTLWLYPGQPEHVALWTVRVPTRDRGTVFGRRAFVRLAPGFTFDEASAELQTLADRGRVLDGQIDGEDIRYEVTPLAESLSREARPTLFSLLGAAVSVLLLACCNVAALLVARADARRSEWMTRAALGADRGRLLLAGLLEATALACAGGGLGLLLAVFLRRVLLAWPSLELPRLDSSPFHWQTVGFSLGAIVLTALLAGALPAWRSSRHQRLVSSQTRGALGSASGRLANALPALQIALALTLLASAGVLLRTFLHLQRVDVGFDTEQVVTFDFAVPQEHIQDHAARMQLNRQVRDRIAEIPGVHAVGLTSVLPFSGRQNLATYTYDGAKARLGDLTGSFHRVFPGTFAALGVDLVRGRDFEFTDASNPNQQVIVSRSLAESAWPGEDPLGRTLQIDFATDDGGTALSGARVIGVVEDVREVDLSSDREAPQAYLVYGERSFAQDFLVRSELPTDDLRRRIRAALAGIGPSLLLDDYEVLGARLRHATARERLALVVATSFSAFALLIATLGVYAAMRQRVVRRRREIGLRIALGADRNTVSRWVLAKGVRLGVQGCAAGLLISAVGLRSMRHFVSGVAPYDPIVIVSVSALLLLSCLAASWWPARRAGHIDPVRTLTSD